MVQRRSLPVLIGSVILLALVAPAAGSEGGTAGCDTWELVPYDADSAAEAGPLACIEYLLKAERIGYRPDWYGLVKAYREAGDESRVKAIADAMIVCVDVGEYVSYLSADWDSPMVLVDAYIQIGQLELARRIVAWLEGTADEQTDLVARTGLRIEAARARALLGDRKEASDLLVSCFNALAQSGSAVDDRTVAQLVSRIWHDFLVAGNYDAAVQAATARQDPGHRMEALLGSAERLAESGQPDQALLALSMADQTLRDYGRYAGASSSTLESNGVGWVMRSAKLVSGLGKPLEVQNVIGAALAIPGAASVDRQASRRASIAEALGEMGKTDQGLDFLNDTMPLVTEIDDLSGRLTLMCECSIAYSALGDSGVARELAALAQEHADELLNDTLRENVYRGLVGCYAALDDLDGLIGCILRLERTDDIRLALRTLSGVMLRQSLAGAAGYEAELRAILRRADSLHD